VKADKLLKLEEEKSKYLKELCVGKLKLYARGGKLLFNYKVQ